MGGDYKRGMAHVDVVSYAGYNCYYLMSGSKDVVIVPQAVTKSMSLSPGLDNWYVPDSAESFDYLNLLPAYYRVQLRPNSILVFNSTGCVHHFSNDIDIENGSVSAPQALSIRVAHSVHSDPRNWLSSAFDPRVWFRHSEHAAQTIMCSVGESFSVQRD